MSKFVVAEVFECPFDCELDFGREPCHGCQEDGTYLVAKVPVKPIPYGGCRGGEWVETRRPPRDR